MLTSDKLDFRAKTNIINKEGHYLMIKRVNAPRGLDYHSNPRSVYMPNNKAKKYMKQKLIKLKEEIDKSTVVIGDFTLFLTTDRKLHRKATRRYVLVC